MPRFLNDQEDAGLGRSNENGFQKVGLRCSFLFIVVQTKHYTRQRRKLLKTAEKHKKFADENFHVPQSKEVPLPLPFAGAKRHPHLFRKVLRRVRPKNLSPKKT
jgi:hypothetical protein